MRGAGGASASRLMRRSASADRLVPAAAAAPAPPPVPAAAAARRAAGWQHERRLALRFKGYRLGLTVPSEMWGAVALAARMVQPAGGAAGALPLPRTASVLVQAFSSAAAASVPPPLAGRVSEDDPKALAEALEWRPKLGAAEDAACLLAPAAACAAVYAATAPAAVQPLYAACMALLYALLIAATRMWLLERRYKAMQRSERELASADSRFVHVDGVQLRYKRRAPLAGSAASGPPGVVSSSGGGGAAQPPAAVVHCLHGFGASSYSWSFVQQELADALRAVVTAHDMPGFGLSQRPPSSACYTLHFNGDAARRIIDAELAGQQGGSGLAGHPPAGVAAPALQPAWAAGAGSEQEEEEGGALCSAEALRSHPIAATPSASRSSSLASLASSAGPPGGASDGSQQQPKRVLIGHSMGGAAAAEGVISHPEGVAALVLVAPAIVALWLGPPKEAAGDAVATGLAVVEEIVSAEDSPGDLSRLASAPSSSQMLSRSPSASSNGSSSGGGSAGPSLAARGRRMVRTAVAVAKAVLMLVVRLLLATATPVMVFLLRRVVRSRRFWERGLASAWHDSQRMTREYVDAYRSGQLVRGWEAGILRFLAARFAEKSGFWGSIREAVQGTGHLTQAERLARAVRRHGIRVLVVHGSSDALVPAANSRRLAALLPNTELVVFEGCGHMPQEECPERFVQTVQRFMESLDDPQP